MTSHNALRNAQNGPGRDETHEQAHRVVSPDSVRTGTILEGLTPREHEVYELAATGMSIRDMADRLYIEPGTVKSYLWQIRAWRGVDIPNRVPHRHLPVPAPDDRLRPSERRVCELARRGYTNVQIGERLGISPNVVRLHLHTARQRVQELEAAS